jgi:hypothetical protein
MSFILLEEQDLYVRLGSSIVHLLAARRLANHILPIV